MKINMDDDLVEPVEKAVEDGTATISDAIAMFLELEWLVRTCDNCINDRGNEKPFGSTCILLPGVNHCGHWVSKRYPLTKHPWKQLYGKLKKKWHG